MWPDRVVVDAPLLEQDLSFPQGVEQLPSKELIPKPGDEAFTVAVLPGSSRLTMRFVPATSAERKGQAMVRKTLDL